MSKVEAEDERNRRSNRQGVSEAALIEARRAKAARLRERGDNPFRNDYGRDLELTPLADVRATFDDLKGDDGKYETEAVEARDKRFSVAGRILFLRSFGGMTFVRLRDRTGELQLSCDQEALGDAYGKLDDLDLGDFVEATGKLTATKRGELSVLVESFDLLTKALRPPPTKTSFKDVESRYRQRYVDLIANPSVTDVFRARSAVLAACRRFLDERGFVEVETPSMVTLIGGAAAKPFTTHHNVLDLDLYLRIAPELFLKRLVVGGLERVYEVARCYRNEGISTRHNPEFTMLEYYQAYARYETLMDNTEAMLRFVDDEIARVLPEQHAGWKAGRTFTFDKFVRVPMMQAIEAGLRAAGLPSEVTHGVIADDAPIKEWAKTAKGNKRDIDWSNFRKAAKGCTTPGERVFIAYEYLAEPYLTQDYRSDDGAFSVPVFIIDYPFEVSPLARRKDADPSLTDRFELFIDGRELLNAFSELNDPDDQADRFREQVAKKARGEEETMDYDEDYIRALEHGMPPTAGFGMGIDRLVMLLTGSASIRDVILFPLLRPAGGASGSS